MRLRADSARLWTGWLCVAVLAALTGTSSEAQTSGGVITGQIRSMTGAPITGVRVSAMPVPGPGEPADALAQASRITQTDSSGRYRLEDVPPGRYYVVAGLIAAPTYYPGVGSSDGATIVPVASGSLTESVDLIMSPGSAALRVKGRVIRDLSAPAQPTQTAVLTGPPGPSLQSVVAADGSFEFPRVPPGSYQLRIQPSTQANNPKTIVVEDREITDIELLAPFPLNVSGQIEVANNGPVPRFTLSLVSASGSVDIPAPVQTDGNLRLTLPLGEYRVVLKGIPEVYRVVSMTYGAIDLLANPMKVSVGDASLFRVSFAITRPVPFVKLSGHVVGPRNVGTASAPLYGSIRLQSDAWLQESTSAIAADGSFEIAKILPGTYSAVIGPVRSTIVVGEKDMSGVEFIIPPDRQLSGRIVVVDGSPLPRPTQLSFAGTGQIQQTNSISGIAPDGTFKATLPEGEYRVTLQFPADYYRIREISTPLDSLLKIGVGTNEWSVTVGAAPTAAWSKISGNVSGAEYLPADGRRVVLSGPAVLVDVEAPIASNGQFTFDKVLPGSYTLRLVQSPLGSTSASVTVMPGIPNIGGLTITLPPQVALTGKVVVPDGEALTRLTMILNGPSGTVLLVFPTPPIAKSDGASGLTLIGIQTNGAFNGSLPEGAYRVGGITAPSGFIVKSVSSGSIDLLQQPLNVTAGTPPEEIRVVLARNPN